MKKLLSILSAGVILGMSSNSIISETTITALKTDATVNVNIDKLTLNAGSNIYDEIRYELAAQASVDSYQIKNDSKIHLSFYFDNLYLPENTIAQYGTTYTLKISVDAGDKYFNALQETTKEIPVDIVKADLDITKFTLNIGDNIYDDINNDIKSQAPNGVTLADIQNDKEIIFGISEVQNKLLPKNTIVQSNTLYTVQIAVSSADKYFNALSFSSQEISTKPSIDKNNFKILPCLSVYDQVYFELARQAKTSIENIEGDANIAILIKNDRGLPIPKNKKAEGNKGYNISIKVESDKYFNNTSLNWIEKTSPINLNTKKLSLSSTQVIYDNIRYEIAQQVCVDSLYIKNDSKINIKFYDANGKEIKEGKRSISKSKYHLELSVSANDSYFNQLTFSEDIIAS